MASGKAYALAGMPIFRPGTQVGLLPKWTELRPGTYRVGAERIKVRLANGKELELGTGYLDLEISTSKE